MSRRDKSTESIMKEVDRLSIDINTISNELVEKYCVDLDKVINDIRNILNRSSSSDIDNNLLEDYILKVATALYFTGSAQEDLGVKEDTCKAIRQELYTKIRNESTGTIADKDSVATLATQLETITLSIYSRAYKKVKLRMDAGYEMLNSLKKIMNRRIAENELSNSKYINNTRE